MDGKIDLLLQLYTPRGDIVFTQKYSLAKNEEVFIAWGPVRVTWFVAYSGQTEAWSGFSSIEEGKLRILQLDEATLQSGNKFY